MMSFVMEGSVPTEIADGNFHRCRDLISVGADEILPRRSIVVAKALCILSAKVIRRNWFTILMVCCTLLICYSRIYLAKHYPMDILWGSLLGVVLGLVAARLFAHFTKRRSRFAIR